jgi:hypothetical protein
LTEDPLSDRPRDPLALRQHARLRPRDWQAALGRSSAWRQLELATIDGVAQILLLSAPGAVSLAPADGTLLWEHTWEGGAIVQPALTADGGNLINAMSMMGGMATRRLAVAHGWTPKKSAHAGTPSDSRHCSVSGYFRDQVRRGGRRVAGQRNRKRRSNSVSVDRHGSGRSSAFSPQTVPFSGTCADQTGVNGNISADPVFFRESRGDVPPDYHLQQTSPAVDAGDNAAPQIPTLDLDGAARIFDGDFDGNARVDLGAYEYFNAPPTATAGPDQTVVADAGCAALVALDGTGSSDVDGDPLTYSWTGSFGTVSGATASVSLRAGTHVVALTVRDGRGASATDTLVVTVLDKVPPVIQSLTASPSVLPPANKQLVPVTIAVSATDACGGSVHCRIVSVTSNEALGATDWRITGELTLTLRADQSKKGTGRIYTITVECVDASGNVSTKKATVTVPR